MINRLQKTGEATSKISDRINTRGQRYKLSLKGRNIEVIHYKKKNRPVIFTMHGGGFIIGGCAFDDRMWEDMCEKLDVNIVSIGYRKAPLHVFPDALDDVCDVIEHCLTTECGMELDTKRAAVFGNSAGANLAAACCLRFAASDKKFISKALLNYPLLDLTKTAYEKGEEGEGALEAEAFHAAYLRDHDPSDMFASPVCAGRDILSKMPDTWISVCGNDSLRNEGERFCRMLSDAGVRTELHLAKDMPHAYFEYNYGAPGKMEDPVISELRRSGRMEEESKMTLEFFKDALSDWKA